MKKLVEFTGNLSASFSSLIKVLFVSKKFGKKTRVERRGEDILILANGPSMKTVLDDPEKRSELVNRDVLCVNHFCESDYYQQVQPRFYITAAPEMYQRVVSADIQAKREKFWKALVDKTEWRMDFFIPHIAKKNDFWLKLLQQNPNIQVHYYNLTAIEGFDFLKHYWYGRGLGMPRVHNIAGYSIMKMMNLGYGKIYLTGVEHSWLGQIHVTEENIALVGQPHLYDPNKKPETMSKDGVDTRKLHEILHKFYLAFRGYWNIEYYAQKKNVKVYNLTKGSFIDAFERKDFDEYLGKK